MKVEASIRLRHGILEDAAAGLQSEIRELLQAAASEQGWHFNDRVKGLESFALKLSMGRTVEDFYACSLIVPTLADVPEATKLVEACVEVVDRRPKDPIKTRPGEFNFDSLRLYCRLRPSVKPTDRHAMKFEVQIKTLLAEAWSRATHDFSYKSEVISWGRDRLAAQLKAMLDHVELSIAEAASLGAAPSLARTNLGYEVRSQILEWLRDDIGSKPGVLMPGDLRRLSDAIDRLLRLTKVELSELKVWLEEDTADGRGTETRNLSLYAIILETVLKHRPAAARRKVTGRGDAIYLPQELEAATGLGADDLTSFWRNADDDGSGVRTSARSD